MAVKIPRRARHLELLPEVQHALVEWIAKKAYDNKAVSGTESLNYCIAKFGTAIPRG
jgi:hypothetical protein